MLVVWGIFDVFVGIGSVCVVGVVGADVQASVHLFFALLCRFPRNVTRDFGPKVFTTEIHAHLSVL
jgi:tetrahydromethanopterin S-methyltransferase subunit E